MATTFGIAAHKATTSNIIRSLMGWIQGTTGADYAASAALCRDTDGTLKRWNQIHSLSTMVPYSPADPTIDVQEILQSGKSPVLMFRVPTPYPLMRAMGESCGTQVYECHLTAFFYQALESNADRIDEARTRKQMANGTDQLIRLLQYRGGSFPVYDFSATPPQDNLLGNGMISSVNNPFPRGENYTTDFVFYASVFRQVD